MPSPSPLTRYLTRQSDFQEPSSSSSPLPALYADLAAHRTSNRPSFEASVDWWARLLFKACLVGVQSGSTSKGKQVEGRGDDGDGDRLVLHLNQHLLEECTIEEVGRPLGLGTVAMELQSSRRLHPLRVYLNSNTSLQGPSAVRSGISSKVYSIATIPLTWALSQISLNLGFGEGHDTEAGEEDWKRGRGDWVVWDNAAILTDTILSIHRSSPRLSPLESLFSMQTFQSQLVVPALSQLRESADVETQEAPHCSALDLQVLIKYMTRDKGVAVSDGKVIKLEHIEGENLDSITEEERGIVNVKDTYSRLESQIEEIEKRIKERQEKVEKALKEKKREQAMSYLRSRKMLDELLEKRTKSLETLHCVLMKIEQAASDVEIVKAYELSTSSLKALLSDARLQPDHIDQSMEQMQETLANADEVRRAVEVGNEGIQRAAGVEEVDDGEMEAELKKLEEENKKEQDDKAQKEAREEKLSRLAELERRKQEVEKNIERELPPRKEEEERQQLKELVLTQ